MFVIFIPSPEIFVVFIIEPIVVVIVDGIDHQKLVALDQLRRVRQHISSRRDPAEPAKYCLPFLRQAIIDE